MKYREFERLEQLSEDYEVCFLAIRAAHNEGRDLIAAIKARIAGERDRDQARAEELRAQTSDKTRSETVRRIAAQELERLQRAEYHMTAEEQAAINDCEAEIKMALSDAISTRERLNDAIKAAKAAVETIKDRSYSGKDLPVVKEWAKGLFGEMKSIN